MKNIDDTANIDPSCVLDTGEFGRIDIGHRSRLKHGVIVRAMDKFVLLGKRVTIGEYTYIAGHGGVTIGDFCIIAPQCCISAAQHIFSDESVPIRFQGETARGIEIGRDVWIGARCVVSSSERDS